MQYIKWRMGYQRIERSTCVCIMSANGSYIYTDIHVYALHICSHYSTHRNPIES